MIISLHATAPASQTKSTPPSIPEKCVYSSAGLGHAVPYWFGYTRILTGADHLIRHLFHLHAAKAIEEEYFGMGNSSAGNIPRMIKEAVNI